MAKKIFQLNAATVEKVIVAMLIKQVNDLRHEGLTDRAISRKLNLPRWIIRGIKS